MEFASVNGALPLSPDESFRFEDLSKVYFEDFCVAPHLFRSGVKGYPQTAVRSESFQLEDGLVGKRQVSTPTDEDLAELLADVSKENGELNRLTCSDPHSCAYDFDTLPVVNNVSLSEGIVFTAQNVSEMSLMQQQQQTAIDAVLSPSAPTTLYNETSAPSFWMQQAEMAPSDSE
uniref:NAC domain-containing protein n=1 Tax=Angiostrongylus cantonensis TaxID=6313 RepID=A0A0K0CZR2_ANGCA